MKLKTNALALATAGVSAASMLVIGIFGRIGIYMGVVDFMRQVHAYFSLSLAGIVSGMIEAAIVGYIVGYVFAKMYNSLV